MTIIRELESTFERLIRHVDIAKDDLEHMKSTIKERMAIYEKIAFKANYLKLDIYICHIYIYIKLFISIIFIKIIQLSYLNL